MKQETKTEVVCFLQNMLDFCYGKTKREIMAAAKEKLKPAIPDVDWKKVAAFLTQVIPMLLSYLK